MNKKIVIPLIVLIIVLVGGILAWQFWPKKVETPAPAVEMPKVNLVTTKLAEVLQGHSLIAHAVYFSSDGRRIAFEAQKEGKTYFILDGKESPQKYDKIYKPFSFDFLF